MSTNWADPRGLSQTDVTNWAKFNRRTALKSHFADSNVSFKQRASSYKHISFIIYYLLIYMYKEMKSVVSVIRRNIVDKRVEIHLSGLELQQNAL